MNRKLNQGNITILKPGKKALKEADEAGVEYKTTKRGGVLMNYDNGNAKQFVETCLLKHRMLINPIIDWEEDDVWEFLNNNKIPHCCLYDEGWHRIGCIGCPMGNRKGMERGFKRYPKYKAMYMKAFKRMIDARTGEIAAGKELKELWQTPEEVMAWWMR